MSRRRTGPPPTLAEREASARAVTAERVAAERAAARAARVADVRARLALAEARRAPVPPYGDPLAERAAAIRAEQARAARLVSLAPDMARERQRRYGDALAAVTDHAAHIDTTWSPT